MQKSEKGEMITELHDKFTRARVAILTQYSGLRVEEMRDLRIKLRGVGGELRVIKNRLASKASEGTSLEGVKDYFKGPTAIVFGYNDPVGPTRVVKEFSAKAKGKLDLKAGVIEGKIIQKEDIIVVAELPAKEVLIAQVLTRMRSPITGFIFCLKETLNRFVATLNGIVEKKKDQKE